MKLFKNGVDLSSCVFDFLQQSTNIVVLAPYIKIETLSIIIGHNKHINSVVVRWEYKDLSQGSSDLDVYTFLKERDIPLFRNPRLHLKAFIDNNRRCLLTSANISMRALNLPATPIYNYEIGAIIENMSIDDRLYFKDIENESLLITDDLFEQIKSQVEITKYNKSKDFKFISSNSEKDFLVSSLPMSYSVTSLIENYFSIDSISELELSCMIHDLSTYKIPLGLTPLQLHSLLSTSFFNHNFIKAFLKNLDENDEIYFGAAKAWIQNNCTNVPVPRRWELTENIQILFRWIVELGDGLYQVDRPNYSERLWKGVLHDD